MNESLVKSAGPLRRLGAMLYDTLLVVAVLMVMTAIFLIATGGRTPDSNIVLLYLYRLIAVAGVVAFFGFFWTRKGRTLGMQAWKLRIETLDRQLPNWKDTALRLLAAAVPWTPSFLTIAVATQTSGRSTLMKIGVALLAVGILNYIAAYWTTDRRALHERWLKTSIVLLK